jgi:hypothetical protein
VLALSLFDGFYSFVAIIEGALLAEVIGHMQNESHTFLGVVIGAGH